MQLQLVSKIHRVVWNNLYELLASSKFPTLVVDD